MSLSFAMAFTAHDKDQVQRWLTWVEELGGLDGHRLFLMPFKGLPADFATTIPFMAVPDSMGIMSDWTDNMKTDARCASGANSMFRQFAWFFYPIATPAKFGPWMFIEPDCIPLRKGWANEISAEYETCGKPFMAALVEGKPDLFPTHPTGNMVCPERTPELSKLLMLPTNVQIIGGTQRWVEQAFDVACAPEILPKLHVTELIQHVFRGPEFEKMEDLGRLNPKACLFHTSKDGSLIERLREASRGSRAPAAPLEKAQKAETPRVFTYFRPCVDPEALAEQKRILVIWEKNWREHGWEPVVLTENDARKHRQFEKYRTAFEAMPTVSPKEVEMASFLRHVAMSTLGEGDHLLVDYDSLNNGFAAIPANDLSRFPLILCDNNPVPCAVLGTARQFQNAIDAFLTCPISEEQGQPHQSDMHAVQKLKFPAKDVCREAGTPSWEKAALIHFSHRQCGKRRSEEMRKFMEPKPPALPTEAPRPIMDEIRERLKWIKDNSRGITRHHVHRELKRLGLLPK